MPRPRPRTLAADREKLRCLILSSGVPKQLFAQWVFGVDQMSAQRYLADADIPWPRLNWLRHVERIERAGGELWIVLRWDDDGASPYLD